MSAKLDHKGKSTFYYGNAMVDWKDILPAQKDDSSIKPAAISSNKNSNIEIKKLSDSVDELSLKISQCLKLSAELNFLLKDINRLS